MLWQYRLLINCNTSTTLVGNIDNGGSYASVGARGFYIIEHALNFFNQKINKWINRIESEPIWDIYKGHLVELVFKKRQRDLIQISCKYYVVIAKELFQKYFHES